MPNPRILQIALNFIPQIGAVTARNLISYCGGIDALFAAKKHQLLKIPGIGEVKASQFLNAKDTAILSAEAEFLMMQKKGIDLIFYLDQNYPQRLKSYQDAPLLLYKKGEIEPNPTRTVAIVGTRKPSHYGRKQCEIIIEQLKSFNCTIISGLAYGIDTFAHRMAVQCGIPTIGVLGNGINKIYPASNRELAQKMCLNGGIYSEFALNTKPDRENFPRRNRIIAAISDVVLVVESAVKGGSIITAEYANNYYKDVFAIPGALDHPMSKGCNMLIKSHKAHLCMSAKDIAYILRWDQKTKSKQMRLNLDLSAQEKEILNLIKQKNESAFDHLIHSTNFALPELNAVLLNLEFKGLVKSLPGKKYILA